MKRYQSRVPGSVQKMRLDEYVMEWLAQALGQSLSKTKIRNLIMSGSVYVNRHRNKIPTTTLYAGAFIEVYYDDEKANQGKVRFEYVRLRPELIAYEDEWLIVFNKPSGLPTQPTVDPNRPNLFDLVKRFLAEREKKDECYVGLHHRLDKDTSGLVLFTKKEEANVGVSELFKEHLLEKSYQCITWRSPAAPKLEPNDVFIIENYLGKISEKNDISKYGQVESGGSFANTAFRAIETFRDAYWLEARPKTGRTHQIRVHCAEEGMPIVADTLYFPPDVITMIQAPRLMLHAAMLRFNHPITGKPTVVEATLPDDMIQVLGMLKK